MKVHDLTEKTTVAQTDEVYLIQSPYGFGDDRRASVANLAKAVGSFQNRGDADTWDWLKTGLTLDEAWHDLDCSAIVPADTKLIEFYVEIATGVGGSGEFKMRKKGNAYNYNVDGLYVGVKIGRAHV